MLYYRTMQGGFEANFPVKVLLCDEVTALGQHVTVFIRPDSVKMFFIDGEEQAASDYVDDFNKSFFKLGCGKDLLIIGAGGGGPAKWGLRLGAEKVVQVDINMTGLEISYGVIWMQGLKQ